MKFKLKLHHFHTSHGRELVRVCQNSILETCAYQLRTYKSAFYSYNFQFRLFRFGKEEGDVSRFMVTMCLCHDHQRCVMYVLSYVSVVVDFLQTIIWKSLFAAVCAR